MTLQAKIDQLINLITDIEKDYQNTDQDQEFERYVAQLDDLAREYRSVYQRRVG